MGRRQRHINHAHLGAMFALDARFLGLADGASVDTWADRGGSGKQVTQTGTARPTLQGNWVVLDGVNDSLSGSDSGFPTGDCFCSTAVKHFTSLASNTGSVIFQWGIPTVSQLMALAYVDNFDFGGDAIGVTQYGNGVGIPSSTGNRLIHQMRRSGTTVAEFRISNNGGAETVKNMSVTTTLGGGSALQVGDSANAGSVEIATISLFASVPSESIRRRVAHSQGFSFKLPFA